MRATTIPIDTNKLRQELARRGISANELSIQMGYGRTAIKNAFARESMSRPMYTYICNFLGCEQEAFIAAASSGTEEQATAPEETERIISYICDIGKIQTDILREIKELHKDVVAAINIANESTAVCVKETHNTGEAVRNSGVAINKNLSNIYNHLKFGGK